MRVSPSKTHALSIARDLSFAILPACSDVLQSFQPDHLASHGFDATATALLAPALAVE
jgi:hypothetical protein